jgi:hypothetical protein
LASKRIVGAAKASVIATVAPLPVRPVSPVP